METDVIRYNLTERGRMHRGVERRFDIPRVVEAINGASGNTILTLPISTNAPEHRHVFTRMDSSANAVSIVGQFSDGATTKTMTDAAGLRCIASAAANRWAF